MRVLLVGGGGREHALGWKLAQSPRLDTLISLPGNPGLAGLGPCLDRIDPNDPSAVTGAARNHRIDLVIIGGEAPLAAGVTDSLTTAGVPVWGPSRSAARLETSKAFAKKVMDQAGVATAGWGEFNELEPALAYLDARKGPYVIKADGLAAGKGVLVTDNVVDAAEWVRRCLLGSFGKPAVVIEEFLDGPEVSVFALCAGTEAVTLDPARDFKRLGDGDRGPNTGGMGAYSPVSDLPVDLTDSTIQDVINPVLRIMESDGNPYSGFLYVGLVLTTDGPKVLEFNCRLGDPETQVVIPRLENDLIDVIEAAMVSQLRSMDLRWSSQAFVDVVLAAPGYPESPENGVPLVVGRQPDDVLLFHAGTKLADGQLVSSGGRVLNVVGRGFSVTEGRDRAYAAVERIHFPGAQYRRDIGEPTPDRVSR